MKVLFFARSNLMKNKAGDTIQVQKTQEYLRKMGVETKLEMSPVADLSSYDIVHLFNNNNPGELNLQFYCCKQQGKKTALSTIYWDMTEYLKMDENTSTPIDWWHGVNSRKKEIFQKTDLLLPNSEGEYQRLAQDLKIHNRYHVVPNGVDKFFLRGKAETFINKFKISNFVLCVGRVAHRKNQLALVRALNGTGIPMVFIGSQNNRSYVKRCREEADSNTYFINEIPHHVLPGAYAAARIHVLPSWFETPGLASLEAALSGCNVVVTPGGTTREYFGNLVDYCDPSNVDSIREAVLSSLEKDPDPKLKDHVLQNFTWEKTAWETLRAYEMLLSE